MPYRVILAAIWLTIASAASLGLLYKLREVVFDLVIATFIALVLNPVVVRLHRLGMKRGLAILTASAVTFLLVVGIGTAVAAPLTSQGVKFARQAPQYLKQAQEGKGPVGAFATRFHLEKQLRKAVPAISKYLSKLPGQVVGLLRSAASTAFRVAIVAILAIFMLVEGPALVGAFMAGVPPGKRESIRAVGQTTSRVVSGYTIGVVMLAILNGLVTALALAAMGVPFVSSLSIWAGAVDVLPIIGGLVGIVPAALFAFAHSVVAGIVVVAVMFASSSSPRRRSGCSCAIPRCRTPPPPWPQNRPGRLPGPRPRRASSPPAPRTSPRAPRPEPAGSEEGRHERQRACARPAGPGTRLCDPALSMSSRLSPDTGPLQAAPERVPTWEEVAAEHGRFVYSLAHRLTGSAADAEDLAQDVLLRVRTALEGWLLRITTNLFYDRMRHRARHPTEPLDPLDDPSTIEPPSGAPSPEDTALRGELKSVVEEALRSLPYQFRVAVLLCDLYQMRYEEIGSTMGWRIGTVRSRIHRGRALMRTRLAPYVEASES